MNKLSEPILDSARKLQLMNEVQMFEASSTTSMKGQSYSGQKILEMRKKKI